MQRTDAEVVADHQTRIALRKELARELRKGGVRLVGRSPLAAFEAGARSNKAKLRAVARKAGK